MSWIILDLLRKNPEELKEHIRKRFLDPSLVDKAYQRTKKLLWHKRQKLESVAQELLQKEVIFQQDLERLIGPRPFPMHDSSLDKKATKNEEATTRRLTNNYKRRPSHNKRPVTSSQPTDQQQANKQPHQHE